MPNDSIRTAFNHGPRATSVRLSLEKTMDSYPEPEQTPPTGMTPDEYLASQPTTKHPHLARIYPWSFWYRGRGGDAHQVILEATYEDAQRVWDKLSTTLDMTSKRP